VADAFKRVRRAAYAPALRALVGAASLLPRPAAIGLGRTMGFRALHLARRDRGRSIEHIRLALGAEKTPSEIRTIARRAFMNLGAAAFELASMAGRAPEKILALFDEMEPGSIEELIGRIKERGAVLVSGHVGNWELFGGWLAARGVPLEVVGRRIYHEPINRIIAALRAKMSVPLHYQDSSIRALARRLKEKKALGILADQDVRRIAGVFVDFFGRAAYTPTGPAVLSILTGAPLYFLASVPIGKSHGVVCRRIELQDSGDREEDIKENTRRWTAQLEELVRLHPANWVWMHRRWRTRPEDLLP